MEFVHIPRFNPSINIRGPKLNPLNEKNKDKIKIIPVRK